MTLTKKAVISMETYQTLRPILYVGRFFSLCPVAITKLGPNHYAVKKSKLFTIYSYSFVLFMIGMSAHGQTASYNIDVIYKIRWREHTDRYVTISDICVIFLSSFLAVVLTSVKIDKFLDYLNCLNKIDSLLSKYPAKPAKYLRVSVATLIITIAVLGFDMCLWTKISLKHENLANLLRYFIPFYFCYIYVMIIELIYWHLVHLINVRIIALNRYLDEIDSDRYAIKLNKRNINNIIDRLSMAKRPPETISGVINVSKIRNFVMIYEKILVACNTVNEFYGFIILVTILGCLVHLLATPYGLYSMISQTGDSIFILSQSVWMLGHVLRLALIIEPCHGCTHHTKSTVQTVCRLLSDEFLTDESSKILQIFALHLSRCKIEFTAFDMTVIDRALLTTIAGAVTTYLVILFQFNKN